MIAAYCIRMSSLLGKGGGDWFELEKQRRYQVHRLAFSEHGYGPRIHRLLELRLRPR